MMEAAPPQVPMGGGGFSPVLGPNTGGVRVEVAGVGVGMTPEWIASEAGKATEYCNFEPKKFLLGPPIVWGLLRRCGMRATAIYATFVETSL